MPDIELDVSTIPYRVGLLETAMLTETAERKAADAVADGRLDVMEDRWLRLDGAFSLVKFAFGTSIASALLAIVSIVVLIISLGGAQAT